MFLKAHLTTPYASLNHLYQTSCRIKALVHSVLLFFLHNVFMYICPIYSVLLAKLQVWDFNYCRAAVLLLMSHETKVREEAWWHFEHWKYWRHRHTILGGNLPGMGRIQITSQSFLLKLKIFGTNEPLAEINSQTIYRFFLVSKSVIIWHFKTNLYPVKEIEKNSLTTNTLTFCLQTKNLFILV